MYANPENMEITTMLISIILNIRYELLENKVKLVPLKIPNKTVGEKETERDVVLRVKEEEQAQDKTRIIIEVNIKGYCYEAIINRNIIYLEEVSSSGIRKETNYKEIPTTILVNFNDFFLNDLNEVIDTYFYMNKYGYILSEKRKILNINIAECYKIWYNNNELKGYDDNKKDLIRIGASMCITKKKEFNKCISELRTPEKVKKLMERTVINMCEDEDFLGIYYDKEKDEKMLQEGINLEIKERSHAEGLEEGVKKGIKEAVKSFYKNGASIEMIRKSTSLTEKEIKSILQ